jgi:hypothetical protein
LASLDMGSLVSSFALNYSVHLPLRRGRGPVRACGTAACLEGRAAVAFFWHAAHRPVK